ncbi:YbaB/EbfC family nucleoid-associated protein [Candidatus Aerophobetes bacterium]|uniref:Nucleoid-associated protein DRZ78_03725 n=1 Tax=Aerophobetes bacterium TaxID=2030807 RepID=A0A662D039_UNCAE|nr:MAG: YbaB/EbfC family nucleoid-associated protein [Candidatus Aerophobetes bacterium]
MIDMVKLLRQFQKIQEEAKKIQGELAKEEVVGSSGGGMVKVTFNGKFEVLDVEIERKLLKENDMEMLEELILAAVNDGMKKVQELIKKRVREFTGGLNIPEIGIPGMWG